MIDGCSSFGAFARVVLPVVRFRTGNRAKLLAVAINQYGAEKIEYWSWSAAGVRRHLIKGLTFGTRKAGCPLRGL